MVITFSSSPWLLFLILPAFIMIFALVFTRKKKGAPITVNLVLATIFQCLVATLLIFAISGIRLEKEEKDIPDEVVVLVDGSHTTLAQRENMNNFVYDVIEKSVGQSKVGVILFGQGQKVALYMTQCQSDDDVESAYQKYISVAAAANADDATDISSALKFVWSPSNKQNFISNPQRAKVVILSDGLQTDGNAINAVKELTSNGIKIETSFYASNYLVDSSILDVKYPENVVYANNPLDIVITVKNTQQNVTKLSLTDYDEAGIVKDQEIDVTLQAGTQELTMPYSFDSPGLHMLTFQLKVDDESLQNNVFCSYFQVEEKNKILVLEKYQNESQALNNLLNETDLKENFEIEVKEISQVQDMTAENFAQYNEVILYNFAAGDMTEVFQQEIEKYVNEFGGGVFTVGGFEKDEQGDVKTEKRESSPDLQVPVLHSYKEGDMSESLLADMLPVKFEAYKPAVAVIFVFDVSGSMTTTKDAAILAAAEDARYIMDEVLDTGDYAGIVTLENDYAETAPLSPMTKKEELKDKITDLEDFWDYEASTRYAPALKQAARILATAPSDVARKHIILFSDGGPGDTFDTYSQAMKEINQSQDISLTVVTYYKRVKEVNGVEYYFNHDYDVVGYHINIDNMKNLAQIGDGSFVLLNRDRTAHGVAPFLRKDLKLDQLEDICYQSFKPKMDEQSSILDGVTALELDEITLNGYFSSRAKVGDVSIPLRANDSPLYAEWQYGKGKVGSILIDLEGYWSANLLNSDVGKRIIYNIFSSLLMKVEEKPQDNSFEVTCIEDNFHTQVNIFNLKQDKSRFVAMVQAPDQTIMKYDLGSIKEGARFVFENRQIGVYKIYVMKVPGDFDFSKVDISNFDEISSDNIESQKIYRTFSYSKEFDLNADAFKTGQDLLAQLSSREAVDGLEYSKFVYDGQMIFEPSGTTTRIYDLRVALLISAIVIYLLGIIFRLFKIKFKKRK